MNAVQSSAPRSDTFKDGTHLGRLQATSRRHKHELDPESGVLYTITNTGLFSNCTHALCCLIDLAALGYFPRRIDFSRSFLAYRDNEEPTDLYPALFRTSDDAVARLASACAHSRSLKCPDHHGIYSIYPYGQFNLFMDAYFRPSYEIERLANALQEKYRIDCSNTLAVVYRGSDKGTELKLASPSQYVQAASAVMGGRGRVLIQTDQAQAKALLLGQIPGAFAIEEMPTTGGAKALHLLDSQTLGARKEDFARTLLAVTLLISRCDGIVNHCGNMAAWICLFRGHARGVVQFDRHGRLAGPLQAAAALLKNFLRVARKHWRGELSAYA